MNSTKIKKTLIKLLPYIIVGLVCTNLGEAWRLAEGADMGKKMLSFFSMVGVAFGSPLPSLHPLDLLVGTICGGEVGCVLQSTSGARTQSIIVTMRNTDLPGGGPMRILSPLWIKSLRTT